MLELVATNDILVKYNYKGEENVIKFSDLQPYWDYANEEEFEYGSVKFVNNYILGIITVASVQGGIVFVWDMETKKIVHVSDGSFAVEAEMDDEYVYTTCLVSCWGVKEHEAKYKTKFGTMDAFAEIIKIN